MPVDATATRTLAGPGGSRELAARWVITGDILLETPCHLGNGAESASVDMPLVRDRTEGLPLLTGSSLAGALRDHVNDRTLGFGVEEVPGGETARLFGVGRGEDEGAQSPLIVFDAVGKLPENTTTEIRDGVAIAPTTGTAKEHLKYNLEVLPSGTTFSIRVELLVGNAPQEVTQVGLLAAALSALQHGQIGIGARHARGLGSCRARKWRVRRFDLAGRDGWLAWLGSDPANPNKGMRPHEDIVATMRDAAGGKVRFELPVERRVGVHVELELTTQGGLLVRGPGMTSDAADAVHLHSGGQPILPGTSVAGAIRARATRIAQVVRAAQNDGRRWVDRLFGPRPDRQTGQTLSASRLRVSEQAVTGGRVLRQTRIRSDRFTGGVVDGGLFDEEPLFRGKVTARLELRAPRDGELGLLLLVVKDLLTGDLPLGGATAVGRGVMTGRARIYLPAEEMPHTFDPLLPAEERTVAALNQAVEAFRNAEALSEGS
jgi:CRISPR/Cas system CMR subunit Cmr4 (Cas7 group RAMP superfamily)